MSRIRIKEKNTAVLDILVKDKDGVTATNLANATAISFVIANPLTNVALVTKTLSSGIAVNTPSTGYVRVTLTPTDTTQTPMRYNMALQITWSPTDVYEVNIDVDGIETQNLTIEGDIIA